jgi:NADPH:quinone reductase-like Zn-dependent oxidoreductase
VLIEVKYAPVTPADIYTVRLGGVYDEESREPPFVAGHDAVAVVAKVSSLLRGSGSQKYFIIRCGQHTAAAATPMPTQQYFKPNVPEIRCVCN